MGNYILFENTQYTSMEIPVQQTFSEPSENGKLKAMLKGSIYETGENMTVFGACFDGYGYLIQDPTLNATLSSWYPNGTIWEQDAPMTAVLNSTAGTTGKWLYTVNMGAQMGTYLTEITCRYLGDTANAYGEWQNPDWVKRIATAQNESYQQYYNL
jgi:hypothetical protein